MRGKFKSLTMVNWNGFFARTFDPSGEDGYKSVIIVPSGSRMPALSNTARGSGLHHSGGWPSLNHGKMPWR